MDHCIVPEENSELSRLLSAAKKGDQHAFEELLNRYEPLLGALCGAFSDTSAQEEDQDLRQEAMIAFHKAVQSYQPEKGVTFGLYAKICIRNRLVSYRERQYGRREIVSLEDVPEEIADFHKNPSEKVLENESYLVLCQRIQSLLSPYEKRIWWLFVSGRTAGEIAELVGKDERSVQNALYRIRRKLREAFRNS